MLVEFISLIGLFLPGLWVLQLVGIRFENNIERLSISYILSLTLIFGLLYFGGIINAFNIASFVLLAIVVISFIHLFILFILKILRSPHQFNTSHFLRISTEKLIIILTIGLLYIYVIFLSSRAILDSDVVQYYLPIAREIVNRNGFTYNTGYDSNVLLKPIGGSVLYAWTYVVSNSTLSESFRLMPLVPIIILIVLNYAISTAVIKSKTMSIISTALFLILPFHDRFLLYTALYPDIFYYPLIFIAVYFLLKYYQSKRSSLFFWIGLGLGAASLLKAQTIYFLIAFILVFLLSELRSVKKASAALCLFTPFYILAPRILSDSIQHNGFLLIIPHFTEIQLGLFLFLSTISGICYYVMIPEDGSNTKIDRFMITDLIKKITLIILPFAAISSLWYMNNLLKFGTLIWTYSINLPNYDWALGVLKSTETAQATQNIWHYLVYFIFMFADPAVMGYTMLILFLIGLLSIFRKRLENFNILLLFGIVSASIILSTVILNFYSATSVYNPRDILPLAPLLSTLSSIGIISITPNISTKVHDEKNIITSLLLISYFGLLNYIHSVYVRYIHPYQLTKIGKLMSAFGNSVGLNLSQTSYQLSYGDRVIFVFENISRILSLSLIAGIPVLLLMFPRHYKFFTRGYIIKVKIELRAKKTILKLFTSFRSSRQWLWVKKIFTVFIMLSVIVIPRLEMMNVQGGPQNIQQNQLRRNYGDIYELFANQREFDGGILTFKAPMGLPYYLPDVKIIDLAYPANLASLKACFQSNTPYEAVLILREQNISYLLIHPSINQKLDASLNFTISRIIQDPEYATLVRTFGSWELYILGTYRVEKN